MFGIIFKVFAIGISVVIILYLVASALRRSRRLDARIQAFKEEQEEAQKQGKVVHPYMALSELYTEQEPSRPARRKRSRH